MAGRTADETVAVARPWWADDDEDEPDEVAMQARCVACGVEHYALAVVAISTGAAGCARCGHRPGPMSVPAYRAAIARRNRPAS